jgi:RNA polymerase sigma-70 factor (ECF subfamily)
MSGTECELAQARDVWALVQQVQAGDKEAFAAIYRRYSASIRRFIRFRTGGNEELAEDLTSEVFLRALRRIDSFTWQGRDFGAWLTTIARNLIVDHFKSGRFRLEFLVGGLNTGELGISEPVTEGGASAEDAAIVHFANAALMEAVRGLTSDQRDAVVLRFFRGLSLAETAALMGTTDSAVKALQYRAVRALHAALTKGPRPTRETPAAVSDSAAARAWASEAGISVAEAGRLSEKLLAAYRASDRGGAS